MRSPEGHLLRTYNAGEAKLNAYLEDHAFMLEALLTLYEATFEPRWFGAARELADAIIERFGDPERGGFFQTSSDHERLVARRKEIDDAPIPSGQSSAAFGLLRLAALTGEARYEQAALGVLRLFGDLLRRSPLAFGHLLQALDFHLAAVREVALVGSDTSAMQRVVRAAFRPNVVLAGGDGMTTPAFRCWPAARRTTAWRRPTSASDLCARLPSPKPPSWRTFSDRNRERHSPLPDVHASVHRQILLVVVAKRAGRAKPVLIRLGGIQDRRLQALDVGVGRVRV